MELFKTVPAYSWLYLFIFANTEIYIKLIDKLSRRHLISDVFVIKVFTVVEMSMQCCGKLLSNSFETY